MWVFQFAITDPYKSGTEHVFLEMIPATEEVWRKSKMFISLTQQLSLSHNNRHRVQSYSAATLTSELLAKLL